MTNPTVLLPEDVDSAFSQTGSRLTQRHPNFAFGTSVPNAEPGWVLLSEAVQSGLVDALATELMTKLGPRPNVVGSYLGARLTDPLVSRTVAALVLERRCPDPDARAVHVHRTEAEIDRIAFTGDAAMLHSDPWAGGPGPTFGNVAELRDWWAAGIVATVEPLLATVHERFRFGRRGLWGSVATRVGGTVAAIARDPEAGGAASWREAELLLDALAAHAPAGIVRPTPLLIAWSGGPSLYSVKATCCLKYRVKPEADMATGKGYCSTCPLVAEPCMQANLARKLDGAPTQ